MPPRAVEAQGLSTLYLSDTRFAEACDHRRHGGGIDFVFDLFTPEGGTATLQARLGEQTYTTGLRLATYWRTISF
jgi:hypothetical protein